MKYKLELTEKAKYHLEEWRKSGQKKIIQTDLKTTIMAITIKNIPVLEGTTAEDFIRSAEENATKATPHLSASAKKRLQKVLEKSRSFRFN